MDIQTYLAKHEMSQEDFARFIGVTQGAVWQWLNGHSRIDPRRAKDIEKKTRGQITRHELRPDIFDKERAA